jgi:haloalkane dehalogenase
VAQVKITRHFATIRNGRWGDRQVHYRRGGRGPLVVLLHQSPLSSRDMLATMERWGQHFTCLAPDTPGYGQSDPFGVDRADMADVAQAVIEWFDAVGIRKAPVYGFHTGAMIAGALAQHYPERITCAVGNGYVLLTEAERTEIVANYLPPLEPKWDGSHLTWLWNRMREQTIFFPWYRKGLGDSTSTCRRRKLCRPRHSSCFAQAIIIALDIARHLRCKAIGRCARFVCPH